MYDDLGIFVFFLKNSYSSWLKERAMKAWKKASVNIVSFSSLFFDSSDITLLLDEGFFS